MRIHIIAVGGRIMHTLALSLQEKGHSVTGSDDEIYEPSRSRLEAAGLLPDATGWNEGRITSQIDLVILGMHARKDNPELRRASELEIEIVSYPEFIFRMSQDKKRIVVAGSHGKTSTTAMIMHVLKYRNYDFDYLIGAELDGFPSMISLTDAPLIVIEGDEYLSSCIDRRPKMIHYRPHISVITGIAWDHVNVFKTEEEYVDLFRSFIVTHSETSELFCYRDDGQLDELVEANIGLKNITPYTALPKLENGNVLHDKKQYRVKVFGEHNRANMSAALQVCLSLGITAPDFFAAISSFRGASKRMELLVEGGTTVVYRDFAHAPSKVRATVQALREHYPGKRLVTFLELHTFSSLNVDFLPKYRDSMSMSDCGYIYYSPHTLEIKGMPALAKAEVREAFGKGNLTVVDDRDELEALMNELEVENSVVVMMSSGNFDKIDAKGILINKL